MFGESEVRGGGFGEVSEGEVSESVLEGNKNDSGTNGRKTSHFPRPEF